MTKIFDRLKDFMGFSEDDPEDYGYQEEDAKKEEKPLIKEETKASTSDDAEPERPSRRRYREPSNVAPIKPMENNIRNNNNVIGMPGVNTASSEVVVFEPHSFAEIPKVIQTLRQRRSVVLNLNVMDPEDAQRAVDFVAGGTYAIDGHQERIGESIFLFTPNCVKVSSLIGSTKEDNETSPISSSGSGRDPAWSNESTRIAR